MADTNTVDVPAKATKAKASDAVTAAAPEFSAPFPISAPLPPCGMVYDALAGRSFPISGGEVRHVEFAGDVDVSGVTDAAKALALMAALDRSRYRIGYAVPAAAETPAAS